MRKRLLNLKDEKLRDFCISKPRTIKEIADELKIAGKNVCARLPFLKRMKIIKIIKHGRGGKIHVLTLNKVSKESEYLAQILTYIKNNKGIIPNKLLFEKDKMSKFFGKNDNDSEFYDKFRVITSFPNTNYVERCFRLTEEGKKFLKKQKKLRSI